MAKKKFVWKSADTGRIVSTEYANNNPAECYKHVYKDAEIIKTSKSEEE